MSNYFVTKKKQFKKYVVTHDKFRIFLEYFIALIATSLSALLTTFAFKAFQSPSDGTILTLISGGVSGLSRTIALVFEMAHVSNDTYLVYSITYFVINIPMLYIAFRYIGFRFGIFSALNVVLVSIFTKFIDLKSVDDLAKNVACVIEYKGVLYQCGILARVAFAALINGVSTSLAFAADTSAGGSDILSYYFSLRKSTNVGKYILSINAAVMALFSILFFTNKCVSSGTYSYEFLSDALMILLFSIFYSILLVMVIDFINRRNKKEQIEIITKEENLSKFILSNIHHGATIMKAKGAYSGEDRIIIYMVVSIYETKNIITLIREADPKCWINVVSVKQVYGRFFMRPIK